MSRGEHILLVVVSALAACHRPPSATPEATVAIGAVPAASSDGPALASGHRPFEEQTAPLVSIGRDELCVRIGSRLHCVRDLVPETPISSTPPVAGLDDVIDVTHGAEFGCAVTGRGEVFCWGSNVKAQIGAGLREPNVSAPALVRGVRGARRVFAGENHACAILERGEVACWGDNEVGQTGSAVRYLASAREHALATPVEGIRDATLLALTGEATCALTPARKGFCWGSPPFDRPPDPDRNTKPPGATSKLDAFDDLHAHRGELCGVRHGTVVCAGSDFRRLASSIRDATRVRVGSHHACALLRDGHVSCWGSNYYAVLGHPHFDEKYRPETATPVRSVADAVDLFVGDEMSCAVTATGKLWCWGTFPMTAQHSEKKVERAPVLMAR